MKNNTLIKLPIKNIIILFAVLILSTQIYAQSEVAPQTVITVDEAIHQALNNSRRMESLYTNTQIAEYRYKSSGKLNNPELRYKEETPKRFFDNFNEHRIGIRWQPPRIGELSEDRQQARVEVWDRKVNEIRYRHQLIARVRRSYTSVIMYDMLADLEKQRLALEDERIKVINQMVTLGRRSVVYQTKARMWHAESQNDYLRAVQNKKMARRKLARRCGIDENIRLTAYDTDLPVISVDMDSLSTLAFLNRPEIKLVKQRIRLAEKQKFYETMKLIPWPSFVEYSYRFDRDKVFYDWDESREKNRELRVGINLPIFDWNIGNIKATRLAVKRKEGQSEAIKESIENEVRDAFAIYSDLLLDWQNYSKDARELIADAMSIITEAKVHQTLMPDEVNEMELTLIETRTLLARKRRNLAHALIDLCYTLGLESSDRLK
ncbi:TolC family protein [bacterium]|nr:TolC family protein [bacterium]